MPTTHSEASSFKTFEEARTAIESLIPMQSNQETLTALGIEAGKQPNTTLLTHADVVRRFVSGSMLTKQDFDHGVVLCIEARDACHGLELLANRIDKVRSGNFFTDFLNFSRRTETKGWRFNALILLVDNVVVYRSWGGQPAIDETEVHTNPLGPLQDVGPSVVTVK
ncbi:MAG: hypothetical protein KGN32_02135 [Burkholderiales bacterium]|nr:hypothetical protein [Burkholderiales bacterium]